MESLNPRWARILTFPASGSLPRQNLAKNRRFCPFGATSVVPPTSPAAPSGLRNPKLSRNGRRAFPQAKGAPRNGPGSSSGLRRGGPQESLQEVTALYGLRHRNLPKMGAERFPRHESLTKPEETPRRSKKSISQRTCRIREKGLRTPRHSSSGWLSFCL